MFFVFKKILCLSLAFPFLLTVMTPIFANQKDDSNAALTGVDPLASDPSGQIVFKETEPIFSKSFPRFRDSKSRTWVYQISIEPGMNRTFYYHQAVLQTYDNIIYENLPPKSKYLTYVQINLKTGDRKGAQSKRIKRWLFSKMRGSMAFIMHKIKPGLAQQDVENGEWHMLWTIPDGWNESGSIAVNSDDSSLIYLLQSRNDPNLRRVFLLTINSGRQ